jgi:D-lactate dehydrogenase
MAELEKDYEYDAVQTCAADGMCQTACPVTINTGDLMKRLRRDEAKPVEKAIWNAAAKNWGTVTRGAGVALTAVRSVPVSIILAPNRLARAVLGTDAVPLYSSELPGGGTSRKRPAVTTAPQALPSITVEESESSHA